MAPRLVVPADHPVDWTRIHARGEDAREFLQGQLSCDVSTLEEGDQVEGLVLTPTGDVVTALVCRATTEGHELVMRSEGAERALGALRRFLLRTRCTLSDEGTTEGPYATVGEQVRRGEPGPGEFATSLSPHTFGREYVARHVSFSKGCFTGQELVGRLDSRGGNVPFRLARLSAGDLDDMERVVGSVGPAGERGLQRLTTIVSDAGFIALAIVHRSLLGDAPAATLEGVRVEILHGETQASR